jgi:uncharacterized protein YegL
MEGTLAVTMQQGLQVIRDELQGRLQTINCVYLSTILFGETTQASHLRSSWLFQPPRWRPQGGCYLRPAVEFLAQALQKELLVSRPGYPGDYAPLLFLILGSRPHDDWSRSVAALQTPPGVPSPVMVSLITRPDLAPLVQNWGTLSLLLSYPGGELMSDFFYWAVELVKSLYSQYYKGSSPITIPPVPHGIHRLR